MNNFVEFTHPDDLDGQSLVSAKGGYDEWCKSNSSDSSGHPLEFVAYVAALHKNSWKPIESAPRDGTMFDVWISDRHRIPDCKYIQGELCRYSADNGLFVSDDDLQTATHFMLIASGPKRPKSY